MPFQTITNFSDKQAAKVANPAKVSLTTPKISNFSDFSGSIKAKLYAQEGARAAAEDAAWRQWLDACPRYPGGCFSCASAMMDRIYFCQDANRAVFGADVVEVALLKNDAGTSPAGNPSIMRKARRGYDDTRRH